MKHLNNTDYNVLFDSFFMGGEGEASRLVFDNRQPTTFFQSEAIHCLKYEDQDNT